MTIDNIQSKDSLSQQLELVIRFRPPMRRNRVCPERAQKGGGSLDGSGPQHPASGCYWDAGTQSGHHGRHHEAREEGDGVQGRHLHHEAALRQSRKYQLSTNFSPKKLIPRIAVNTWWAFYTYFKQSFIPKLVLKAHLIVGACLSLPRLVRKNLVLSTNLPIFFINS